MNNWYEIKEQSTGNIRLHFLWFIYKIFKRKGLKFALKIILPFITFFARPAKLAHKNYIKILNNYQKNNHLPTTKFSTLNQITSYAFSLVDKIDILCNKNSTVKLEIEEDTNWKEFISHLNNKKGVFLISSHLGNVEIFSQLPKQFPHYPQIKLNALMQTNQSSTFFNFLSKKIINSNFTLYPTEELDFLNIMKLYENLEAGEIILMAGDRVSATNPSSTISTKLLDNNIYLPKGTFKFAQKFKHPTFAIFTTKEKNTYKISLEKLETSNSTETMAQNYASILEKKLLKYPNQWYNFYNYFNKE